MSLTILNPQRLVEKMNLQHLSYRLCREDLPKIRFVQLGQVMPGGKIEWYTEPLKKRIIWRTFVRPSKKPGVRLQFMIERKRESVEWSIPWIVMERKTTERTRWASSDSGCGYSGWDRKRWVYMVYDRRSVKRDEFCMRVLTEDANKTEE